VLFGSQFPTVSGVAKSGNFTLLSPNYDGLSDRIPGRPTLFTQTSGGTQTLSITKTFANDSELDFNTIDYPYLLVGFVYCGNSPRAGQILPNCTFTLNGKWGGSGAKVCQAGLGPQGYAQAWQMFSRANKVGSTPTTTLNVQMAANFITSFANFGIGEIICIGCDEIPIQSMSEPLTTSTQNNRSSNNTPNIVLGNAYRTLQVAVGPTRRNNVVVVPSTPNLGRSVRDGIVDAARNGACVVSNIWRVPGAFSKTGAADLQTMIRNCYMASMMASPPPTLTYSATDASNAYKGTLAFEELL